MISDAILGNQLEYYEVLLITISKSMEHCNEDFENMPVQKFVGGCPCNIVTNILHLDNLVKLIVTYIHYNELFLLDKY